MDGEERIYNLSKVMWRQLYDELCARYEIGFRFIEIKHFMMQ